MAQMPKAKDLFGDVAPREAAELQEQYLGELNKSFANASTTPGVAPQADPMAQMEALVANKSLSPDAVSALNTALSTQRAISADIAKEITLTSPLSTSFAAFDLEAPAKLLTPRPTPLRNKIVRKKGVGTSHRIKRITGYTGTGTGGQGNIWPGITQFTQNDFAPGAGTPLLYERGPQISYTADDLVLPYNSYSLSDQVSFDANFSGLGYQDLRQLSSTSTLYATMLMEERMMLMARGTGSGYSGALAAPTFTLTAQTATGSQVALTNATYYVYLTSDAGAFGQSVLSSVVSQATTAQVLKINVTVPATGALGYRVYVGTTTGAANAYYCGTITAATGYINAATGATLGNNVALATTGTLASTVSADTSAYATGYDGILPTVLNPTISGSINNINGTFSTANPGAEFQQVFGTLYNNVKADPDEILLNGQDRKQLSDTIKNGSTANYRLNLSQTETGDYVGGAVIGALNNEITGKMVNLTVHPWLPQGVAPVLSYTLPIPDTEVSDVWANILVQDYMGIQWPVNQFSYDFSTYFRGTFMCYAPAWNGVVSGIASA
jgi:hypothetical protein